MTLFKFIDPILVIEDSLMKDESLNEAIITLFDIFTTKFLILESEDNSRKLYLKN